MRISLKHSWTCLRHSVSGTQHNSHSKRQLSSCKTKWNPFSRLPQYPKLGESLGAISQWKFNITVSQVPTGVSVYKIVIFPIYKYSHTMQQLQILQALLRYKKLNIFFQSSQVHSICLEFRFNFLHSRPQTSQSSNTNLLLETRIHAVILPFLMPLKILFSLLRWWFPLVKLSVKSPSPCPGNFKYTVFCVTAVCPCSSNIPKIVL